MEATRWFFFRLNIYVYLFNIATRGCILWDYLTLNIKKKKKRLSWLSLRALSFARSWIHPNSWPNGLQERIIKEGWKIHRNSLFLSLNVHCMPQFSFEAYMGLHVQHGTTFIDLTEWEVERRREDRRKDTSMRCVWSID